MKLIQRLTLLSSLALLTGACDLQQIFDERIDDKQLLVLTPDFADTSVQLVLRDPETLAVLDQDFEVTVYSNKRLVDLNGNYKNQFIARGGVMEFSVSPEETVSESDPLQIGVVGTSVDNTKVISLKEFTYKAKGIHNSAITVSDISSLNEIIGNSIGPPQKKSMKRLTNSTEDVELRLEFNDQDIPIISFYRTSGAIIWNLHTSMSPKSMEYLTYAEEVGVYAWYLWDSELLPDLPLLEDLSISVEGQGRELMDYELQVVYYNSDKDRIQAYIDQDGNYTRRSFPAGPSDFYWGITSEEQYDKFPNYNHEVTVPKNYYFTVAFLFNWRRSDYKVCAQGFNLSFEGAPSDGDLNLMYKATRIDDDQIFTIASFNVNSVSNQYNSLQDGGNNKHVIAVRGNTLEFAENSQYIIEPQVIDLGGEELCGNTYTVRLKRRDTHKKHQLNLSMRNENQNVGLALTFSALLRKQGQGDTAWETVNFKQGSTSVYLEEGSTYEVKLTLADEPFEFTFTNDLSLVEAAVQATLRNVTRIKDINYRINQAADLNTIDAEIVFYEGQSLID